MPGPSGFRLFGLDHLAALFLLAILAGMAAVSARTLSVSRSVWIGRALGVLLVSYAIFMYARLALRGELSFEYSLPLELCHWVLACCVLSLFRQNQLASEIAYFWGFAGTLQAALTPELSEGFPSFDFIQFFWGHGGILLAIVYFIAGQHFRPRPGSVWRMLVAVNVYALIIGTVDAVFGWNYGYLCRKPSQPSLLDYLGPWPWYLVSLEFIAFANFALLALPWKIINHRATEISERSQHK